jgi:hypothetical protein
LTTQKAFADISDDEEKENLVHALDYNDQIIRVGAGIKMNLFYMCAKHDAKCWDPGSTCGMCMAGNIWNRRGAAPEKARNWHCGIESSEWEALMQRQLLPDAGGSRAGKDFDMEHAREQAPLSVGCHCRLRPFEEGGSMVLEVSDKSVENTCALYAIRAAIPPGPLSDEIQKVQKRVDQSRKRTSAQDLYAGIPTIHPQPHLIEGLPILAIRRYPIVQAIAEDWPEIKEENWYRMSVAIATQTPYVLHRIYASCNKKLEPNAAGPAIYAAHCIRSPVQQAPWPSPPPPPPHPPPPLYSVMTQKGAMGFDPDHVIEVRPDEDVRFEC